MRIKNVRVSNPRNVVVQIPGFISHKWGLTNTDILEVHISDDEQSVIIRPKNIQAGSGSDKES